MNSITFDQPRLKEMNDFLFYIYKIGIENSDIMINNSLIYRELEKYGLSDSDIHSCNSLFDKWQDRNIQKGNNKKDLVVFLSPIWDEFLQYYSLSTRLEFQIRDSYIKLYIPIKYHHIYKDINDLFDFICDSNIKHVSKVANSIRSDNVVIRLNINDTKSALKIIDFVNSHFSNKSIGVTNPFVPTINGIGYTFDYGGSYNLELATLMADYINNCIKRNNEPAIDDFIAWVKKYDISREVNATFRAAIGTVNRVAIKEESSFKEQILKEAIETTYNKYGMDQVINALELLIKSGNPIMFTNGDKYYRNRIQNLITSADAKDMIRKILDTNITQIDRDLIVLLCYKMFGNSLYEKIHQVCSVTLNKYNRGQLIKALKMALYLEDYNYFSRYSNIKGDHTNYRELISKIPKQEFLDIIKLSLGIPIIQSEDYDVDDLINTFLDKRICTKYYDNNGRNK